MSWIFNYFLQVLKDPGFHNWIRTLLGLEIVVECLRKSAKRIIDKLYGEFENKFENIGEFSDEERDLMKELYDAYNAGDENKRDSAFEAAFCDKMGHDAENMSLESKEKFPRFHATLEWFRGQLDFEFQDNKKKIDQDTDMSTAKNIFSFSNGETWFEGAEGNFKGNYRVAAAYMGWGGETPVAFRGAKIHRYDLDPLVAMMINLSKEKYVFNDKFKVLDKTKREEIIADYNKNLDMLHQVRAFVLRQSEDK